MWTSTDSDSSASDDEDNHVCVHAPTCMHTMDVLEPFQRNQSFFMANLAKLLDEAPDIHMASYIRWHPTVQNAMQINWPNFIGSYPVIHTALESYKMVRANNSVQSARASWNRKLREWNFKMSPPAHTTWTTYTYCDDAFRPGCNYYDLPNQRR